MASKVYVKNPNGTTYVYENITYWDKETKTSKHKRTCLGHLHPDTGEIVPNRKKGDAAQAKAESVQPPECTVIGSGISLLLDKVSSDLRLTNILKRIFPEDWSSILTCAYFLVSEGRALCRAEKWSSVNLTPFHGSLASQRISELLLRLTPSLQQDFFRAWIQSKQKDEYYALDITSVSSYSESIELVRYGYNRDGENLGQVNMMMVTGEKSNLPLFYQILPGSIKDVSTLEDALENLALLEAFKFHLVMDKGFYSKANVDALYDRHLKFMVGVPFTSSIAKKSVVENREQMDSYKNYCTVFGDELYAVSKLTKWEGHRCYVHTYYDSQKAEKENRKFGHMLLQCKDELESGNTIKAHESNYKEFFMIKETPKRGRKVTYNEEAIQKHKKNCIGWFVLITNDVKDPVKALEIYRRKDTVEKKFDDLKNDLDLKRLRIHSAAAMDGRIFLQYIALILTSRIKTVMNEAGWFKNHDMQEVIDEMKSIRKIRIEGRRKELTTTLTSFQKNIITLFQLNAEQCIIYTGD